MSSDPVSDAKTELKELCDALDACGARLRLGSCEATGGEQGLTADELEIARLRRERIEQESVNLEMGGEIAKLRSELDEARADISVLRDDRDRIRTVSAEALALRDRLSTIVDEAFAPQEVLGMDALLSRLERLLTERARQHEEVRRERDDVRTKLAEMTGCATHWCAEGGRSEREHRETLVRCRSAAQILIAEIGAIGPEDIEETARRAVAVIQLERGQKKSDLLQDLAAARVALRDLVASVEAAGPIATLSRHDLEAARAVLGEDGS